MHIPNNDMNLKEGENVSHKYIRRLDSQLNENGGRALAHAAAYAYVLHMYIY